MCNNQPKKPMDAIAQSTKTENSRKKGNLKCQSITTKSKSKVREVKSVLLGRPSGIPDYGGKDYLVKQVTFESLARMH